MHAANQPEPLTASLLTIYWQALYRARRTAHECFRALEKGTALNENLDGTATDFDRLFTTRDQQLAKRLFNSNDKQRLMDDDQKVIDHINQKLEQLAQKRKPPRVSILTKPARERVVNEYSNMASNAKFQPEPFDYYKFTSQ